MFLTVHSAVGIAVGQLIPNPFLAFIAGLLSHYIFDIIPHGDTKVLAKYKNPIHIVAAGIIDTILTTLYLLSIFILKNQLLNVAVFCAIIGSLLPDVLQLFYYIFKGKILSKIQFFHNYIHNLISAKYELSFRLGLILQIAVWALFTCKIIN